MAPPRPWSTIPINDDGEPLEELPAAFLRLEPHPYALLGAPYGPGVTPFRLRRGVICRLLAAQEDLQCRQQGWRLAIFDAWRPVAVQQFMVDHSIETECRVRGFERASAPAAALREVEEAVARFWAPPSTDPASPPPHSTGAAVDLTLADADGSPLPMGGEIDAIGPVSEPLHYAAAAAAQPGSVAALWHGRRVTLAAVMASAGFVRHPNEWWHFSHGDQLWAWSAGAAAARYGRTGEPGV